MAPSNILIDSHVLIWLINTERGIGPAAKHLIGNAQRVFVSAASIWELSIKMALGQMKLPKTFEADILKTGFIELPVAFTHARAIRDINLPHNDPFNKLLVAQAQTEHLVFLTADRSILSAGFPFVTDVGK